MRLRLRLTVKVRVRVRVRARVQVTGFLVERCSVRPSASARASSSVSSSAGGTGDTATHRPVAVSLTLFAGLRP